jgi:hypothetical protein
MLPRAAWAAQLLAMALAPAAPAGIAVVGATLRVESAEGRTLADAELVGAKLVLRDEKGNARRVRIDAIRRDAAAADPLPLYELSIAGADDVWRPLCEPDPDGRRLAVLQPGVDGGIAFWCTAGALAKCIRFGYRPWERRADGEPMAPYHRACVKMVRADYCGDEQPTTRNGMAIDVYDRLDIQRPEGGAGFSFEAAWDENGAICVAHPRVPQNVTLEALAEACPRLRGRLGPDCTRERAGQLGQPLLFNASRGDGIPGR